MTVKSILNVFLINHLVDPDKETDTKKMDLDFVRMFCDETFLRVKSTEIILSRISGIDSSLSLLQLITCFYQCMCSVQKQTVSLF